MNSKGGKKINPKFSFCSLKCCTLPVMFSLACAARVAESCANNVEIATSPLQISRHYVISCYLEASKNEILHLICYSALTDNHYMGQFSKQQHTRYIQNHLTLNQSSWCLIINSRTCHLTTVTAHLEGPKKP